jgi:hypothetical protein
LNAWVALPVRLRYTIKIKGYTIAENIIIRLR